ncbi:hypothetical protein OG563_41090 [Nocardia vinacea]|uniref:Uncharacterized protein n=1 Tax=Nocardia vinacea TaxID=96468 RepID=A0ABZ1YQA4_9NOCA|nr:hypothetical protein [Nocardia vinacea]
MRSADGPWKEGSGGAGCRRPLALLQIGGALLLFEFVAEVHPLAESGVSGWRTELPF